MKDFDLVITNEISLATALNNRTDGPRIGPFAMTPRQLAREASIELTGRPIADDVSAIRTVLSNPSVSEMEIDGRYVLSEINNLRRICRYTDRPMDFIYTKSAKAVCSAYLSIENTIESILFSGRLNGSVIFKGKRTAVIGEQLFDRMDLRAIPQLFTSIDPFKDGPSSFLEDMTLYRTGNDRQIAQHVVDLIDKEDPGSYAIVLDTRSRMLTALKSELIRNDIRFINEPSVSELASVRLYIRFMEQAMRYKVLTGKDIIRSFSDVNKFKNIGKDDRLCDYSSESDTYESKFNSIMSQAYDGSITFRGTANIFTECSVQYWTVISILDHLGLSDEKVTPETVSFLKYTVSNIHGLNTDELDRLSSRYGVLLADCKNSVYVDRSHVIYLGMEHNWDIELVGKRYISDPSSESKKNAERMCILLQQGGRSSRTYITHCTKDGEEAEPALAFSRITGRPIEDFSDIFHDKKERWLPSTNCGAKRIEEGLQNE